MLLFKILLTKQHFEFSWEMLFRLVIMNDSVGFILFERRIKAKTLLYEIKSVLTLDLENGSSNLQYNFLAFVNWDWSSDENQCSEFGSFIAYRKMILSLAVLISQFNKLKSGMMPAHTNICDSHLAL